MRRELEKNNKTSDDHHDDVKDVNHQPNIHSKIHGINRPRFK